MAHSVDRPDDRATRIRRASREAAHWYVTSLLPEEERTKPLGYSLYRSLLENIAEAAAVYAIEKELDPDDFRLGPLEQGLTMVSNLRYALTGDWNGPLDFWRHELRPMDRIKADNVPQIDRSSVESAVGDYLALPYRSGTLDRFLVKVLVALELYAFGDEMFNEKTFGFLPVSPLKQRHALFAFIRGQLWNAVLLFGIAALALFAHSSGLLSEGWAWGIAGTTTTIFFLLLGTSTLALPFTWQSQRKARRRVHELIASMLEVYHALRSDGPISARHIQEKAESAAKGGVAWPAPLYALLDDVMRRSGRL